MNLVIQDTSLLRVLVNEDENQAHLNAQAFCFTGTSIITDLLQTCQYDYSVVVPNSDLYAVLAREGERERMGTDCLLRLCIRVMDCVL